MSGLYVSEKNATYKNNKNICQVVWCSKEKEIVDLIKDYCCKVFNRKPSITKRKDLYIITLSGKIYYKLFREILNLKSKAKRKRATYIINLTKEFREGFIAGIICGDGNISKCCVITTVNKALANDLVLIFLSLGIYPHLEKSIRKTNFSKKKVTFYKIKVYSEDLKKIKLIGEKAKKLEKTVEKIRTKRLKKYKDFCILKIKTINKIKSKYKYVYDLVVEGNKIFVAGFGWLATYDCDGDEDGVFLLLDGLLNFSREYLPAQRGGKMDAPLVATIILNPAEIDDEAWNLEVSDDYPLEFYEAALKREEFKIDIVENYIDTEDQFRELKFSFDTSKIDAGPKVTSYKRLNTMHEKIITQVKLQNKIRAVDNREAAKKVLEDHFIRDIIGNSRGWGRQVFRCAKCNAKYRRPPLYGRCLKCGSKLIFTVSKGSVTKYLEDAKFIVEYCNLDEYTKDRVKLIEKEVEELFNPVGSQKTLF